MSVPLGPAAPAGPRVCPLLGAEDEQGARQEPILHPSFENRCFAGKQSSPILLTDQATLCLCPAHRACPRLLAGRAVAATQTPTAVKQIAAAPTPIPHAGSNVGINAGKINADEIDLALRDLEAAGVEAARADAQNRSRWGWIGAGLIFMSSLLCGGFFAAYVGWQMVNRDTLAPAPGVVNTVADVAPPPRPQLYIIVTATSAPDADAQSQTVPESPAPLAYPPAVTATPGGPVQAIDNTALQLAQPGQGSTLVHSTEPLPPPNVAVEQPAPVVGQSIAPEMQLAIPTRRPTPVLDIPTSTPAPDGPTPTATPVPLLGPPVVLFGAKDAWLFPGKCTTVSWNVSNVRAVYYDNIGVNGQGEKEECVRDKSGLYTLAVVLDGGETRLYTTTVELVIPTDTPMPTATFTEIPPPTPTWTPAAPTSTPTPNVTYGASLSAGVTELDCAPGQSCQIDIFVTNSGSALDNISVQFLEIGAWPVHLCRLDGVCGPTGLTLVHMAPGNQGLVHLTVNVPTESPYTEAIYSLQAVSEGSAKSERSAVLSIRIRGQ